MDVESLTRELSRLDDEVKLLVRTERRLHDAQKVIEDQLGQFRALNELALRIGRAADAETIVDVTLETLLQVLRVDRAVALLAVPSGGFVVGAVRTQPGLPSPPLRHWPRPYRLPHLPRPLFIRRTRGVCDGLEPSMRRFLDGVGRYLSNDESEAAVEIAFPLRRKNEELLGVVVLLEAGRAHSFHEHWVSEDDLPFLDLVASHAEAALENVQLYGQLSQAALQLERKVAERTADLAQANEGLARSQEELAQALGFREQVMGILGHDLRNPLGAVRMSASFLLRRDGLADEVRHNVVRIGNAADRMGEMIGTLLDFAQSRFRANLPISPEPTDLREICRRSIEELVATHPGRVIQLQVEGDSRGRWDPARIAQLVANLAGNALTHGAKTEAVTISVRADIADVVMAVFNRGPAIAPDLMPVLFEPFRRGPSAERSPSSGGLGLGLYIAHHIVLAHHGSITVRSSEEEGTLFTVRLPRG